MGQAAQFMSGTDSVTVLGADQAVTGHRDDDGKREQCSLHGVVLSIEPGGDVGKAERNRHERGDQPEQRLVGGLHLRQRTGFARLTCHCGAPDTAPREEQGHQRGADEDRPKRFEHREVGDPRAGDPERDQHQRPEATGGSKDRGQPAGEQGATTLRGFSHRILLPTNAIRGVTLLPYISTESRPMHDKTGATIGALAETAGVNVETIRFYQRKGLMPEPEKPYGSIRRYGAAELARVRFIKSAQRLGFSLEEIGELLKLEDGARCSEARQLAEQKLVDVRQKLGDLQRIESVLAGLVARCSAVRGRVNCPLIASLQEAT
jgi:MerR family mercuric resistance operon transcriptional regulator